MLQPCRGRAPIQWMYEKSEWKLSIDQISYSNNQIINRFLATVIVGIFLFLPSSAHHEIYRANHRNYRSIIDSYSNNQNIDFFQPGAACSPSEGVCCNANNCQFHISGGGKECQAVSGVSNWTRLITVVITVLIDWLQETECSYRSTCDGFGAKCPAAIPKVL